MEIIEMHGKIIHFVAAVFAANITYLKCGQVGHYARQ